MHLLIPFAVGDDPASRQTLRSLRLPHLTRLLTRLTPQPAEAEVDDSPALPHERALAKTLGLDPLAPPWAALQAHDLGLEDARDEAWAFITPSHWQVGQAQVTLLAPDELALAEDESRTLLAAMQPYFAEDGITLLYESPTRWLARGAAFRGLATAAPERAVGRDVAPWLPASPLLRRLQNEMQMLLYTHAVNEARAQRRALAVNSFWISGSGALAAAPVAPAERPLVPQTLMQAALRQDWPAWGQAWEALDATQGAALLAALEQGNAAVRLTLCGERQAQTFALAPRSLRSKLSSIFGAQPLSNVMDKL